MTLFARRSSWRRRFTSFAPERSFCPRIFVRRFMKNSVPNQKKKGHLEAAFSIRPRGFEPLTFGSGDQRSIQTELRARKLIVTYPNRCRRRISNLQPIHVTCETQTLLADLQR